MESEPKAYAEIPLDKETPVKNADQNSGPSTTAVLANGDHATNDSFGIGSDTATVHPVLRKSVSWSPILVSDSESPQPLSNRPAPGSLANSFSFKESMFTVKDVLGRWGRKVAEASKKAEDLAGNTWQHLKTGPSFGDAAMGRIAQGMKVIAEGGYEKMFRQNFETVPEEQLHNSYACYLSTSAGPVMGTLYVSTAKLAFCSDSPLSYKSGNQTEWSYYKVVVPLHQLKAVNPSVSQSNPSEKFIQVMSVDNHEFWFIGFLNYNGAVICLQEALQSNTAQSP